MPTRSSVCPAHHRVLYTDQWTPLGWFVTCICGGSFFIDNTQLEENYLAFEYRSPLGPLEDKGVFIHQREMERR